MWYLIQNNANNSYKKYEKNIYILHFMKHTVFFRLQLLLSLPSTKPKAKVLYNDIFTIKISKVALYSLIIWPWISLSFHHAVHLFREKLYYKQEKKIWRKKYVKSELRKKKKMNGKRHQRSEFS